MTSILGLLTFSAIDFWSRLQIQVWILPCGVGSGSILKAIVYLLNCEATIALVGTSRLSGCYCCTKGLQLSKTIDDAFLLQCVQHCLAHLELARREKTSNPAPSLIFLCPVTGMFHVFSSKVLPSSFSGQLTAVPLVCILGRQRVPHCQQFLRRWRTLSTGIFI